ncbi:BadF/BadG/BcrA/BcrD ATPase family protein [Curtobacterium sp. RRHDQ10]|uniref:BadF/BadG/BcrA/BcrD ATPase family protein n=1 Tax=Curtobacterium phyllosphaerae TaxID=3413379 RepID=UPI003BEF8D71
MSGDAEDSAFVIAADAGGTFSRVACFGLDGRLLGSATGEGGSPYHQEGAAENVAETTTRALEDAGRDPADAVALVAGLAMVSRAGSNQGDGDNSWAADFFLVPGMTCDRRILNDAVVAHRGAFLGGPGIIVIAGTGSMILAIDEDGAEFESGQFDHYAGAARHLVFETVHLILTGAAGPEDDELVAAILQAWGTEDVPGLRRVLLGLAGLDRKEVRHRFGALAPIVTAAADRSPLADRALRDLAAKTARGVELLAPLVHSDPVTVSTTGGLATTSGFISSLAAALAAPPTASTKIVPPALDALRGAALMALQDAGSQVDRVVIDRLRASQE